MGGGNPSVSVKYFSGLSESFALLTSVGVRIPVGDKNVGSRSVPDYQFGQSFVVGVKQSRIFGSYSYLYKPEDDDLLDKGDTIGLFGGFDTPVWDFWKTSMYAAFLGSHTASDTIEGFQVGNQRDLIDTTVGLVFRRFNFRFGVTIPTYTESDTIEHSKRSVVFDFGYRYHL